MCVFRSNRAPILGEGGGLQIIELARLVAEVIGYQARIVLDPSYPDGTPQKLLDASRITALGWQAQTPLPEWLKKTYDWFRRSHGLVSREATPFG